MNIFMPYKYINDSVKSLDDVRLNKQCLEIFQLCTLYQKEYIDNIPLIKGYCNHPIYKYYSQSKEGYMFMRNYCILCCAEYLYRFNKFHKCSLLFYKGLPIYTNPVFHPAYIAGQKAKGNQIIDSTDNCYSLYQEKLINKWNMDKEKCRPPKWTNRDMPQFYKENMYGK